MSVNPYSDVRRNVLLALTGLIVGYVRNFLQYHRYSFGSIWEFLGFWFLHYIVVGLLGALFYASLSLADRFVLGREETRRELSLSEAMVYFCVALIVCSVAVFVLAHWPAGLGEALDE